MGILNKLIRDLTESDLDQLKKPLGVKDRPYPMRDIVEIEGPNGKKTRIKQLGLLEVDPENDEGQEPLYVYSERDYAEIIGSAIRNMPTPAMLSMFFDALNGRDPENKRRVQFLKGAAGSGKTFQSELIANMRDPRGPVIVDCTNKDMAELFYETVLDIQRNKRFIDAMDKKIAAFNAAETDEERHKALAVSSVNHLRTHLGTAFKEDSQGHISLDWDKIGHNFEDEEGHPAMSTREATQHSKEALEWVSFKEGMGSGDQNALSMATQEGPLVRAWKEGRELILDEFNRAKEGTTGVLHAALQVFIGEKRFAIAPNSLKEKGEEGQEFVIDAHDMRAGFFVTLTGNTEADGSEVNELPESLSSRIIPEHVPLAREEDWQHRWCQILTGLPVSTLYHSNPDQWADDPAAFRELLLQWRTVGLSDDEKGNVSSFQLQMLERWEDVLEATDKLARFCFNVSQIINADSELHKAGTLSQLMGEIDETYTKEVAMDFRKISYFINKALKRKPEVKSSSESRGYKVEDYSRPPSVSKPDKGAGADDLDSVFGDNLVRSIINFVVQISDERGKASLYNQLMQLAADCGLVDESLEEGKKNDMHMVSQLLNNNPYKSTSQDIRAKWNRDLMCDFLRTCHGDLSPDNDDIMSVPMMKKVLSGDDVDVEIMPAANENEEETEEKETLVKTSIVRVFNDDLDSLQKKPLRDVVSIDSVSLANDDTFSISNLVHQYGLYSTLASPDLREENLTSIFNSAALTESLDTGYDKDESLAMAEGKAKNGLSITTLKLQKDCTDEGAQDLPVHILWNKNKDRLLVVGEGELPDFLKRAAKKSHLIYVDRTAKDALSKAEAAVAAIVSGKDSQKNEKLLKNSFLMRNALPEEAEEAKTSLASLLVHKELNSFGAQYLLNRNDAAPRPRAA